jgi:hypothetical protein
MKNIWKYRFIIIAIIGQILLWNNLDNAKSNSKFILWGIGLVLSFISSMFIFVNSEKK